MRTTFILLAALLVAAPAVAREPAGRDSIDIAPAATLLLPYFEVDLGDSPDGPITSFVITNTSATAGVAHVTLWTDYGVPTYAFGIYLTGYDQEHVDLRLLFNGIIPVTADDGSDPADNISNQGVLSQDINFPGLVAPCQVPTISRLDPATIAALRAAHTGQASSLVGGLCGGRNWGDTVARGFVTIDTVSSCAEATMFPGTPGYIGTHLYASNVLTGQYRIVNRGENFAYADSLVHIQAHTPVTFPGTAPYVAGDYTFYGRLIGGAATDQREPLPTTWMARYLNGGVFGGGTQAIVWRDRWPQTAFACASPPPGLEQDLVVPFDEEENPSYPPFSATRFPLAAERVDLSDPARMPIAPSFGFLLLDLNRVAGAPPFGTTNQSFVAVAHTASGRFAGALAAWPLDNARTPLSFSNIVLPQCADGIDNDGDGLIDYPADPSCRSLTWDNEWPPTCSDGIDNDLDGLIDYPNDPSCPGPLSDFERWTCSDGQDNDGDGFYDHWNDPDCTTPFSTGEKWQCSDGIDNDGDGLIDMADPGCSAVNDPSEAN